MKLADKLSQKQIHRRLEALRPLSAHAKVQPGWVRFMREALGMSLRNLGDRAGTSIPSIQQSELHEASGSISLKKLRQLAEAMDCDLVYAFVPKSKIGEALENAALAKARRLLKVADTHMDLEDQKVHESIEDRVQLLAATLLEKGDIW